MDMSAMDESGSVIFDEERDEDYEPTPEDLREYAEFIGMDPEQDQSFFYIAREGLKAPLPENWRPYKDRHQ